MPTPHEATNIDHWIDGLRNATPDATQEHRTYREARLVRKLVLQRIAGMNGDPQVGRLGSDPGKQGRRWRDLLQRTRIEGLLMPAVSSRSALASVNTPAASITAKPATNCRHFALAAAVLALAVGTGLILQTRTDLVPAVEDDVVMRGDEQAQRIEVPDRATAEAHARKAEALLRGVGVPVRIVFLKQGVRLEARTNMELFESHPDMLEKLKAMNVRVLGYGRIMTVWIYQ